MNPLKPTVPITDPAFQYTNATHTDIRERFRKLGWKPPSESRAPVVPIRPKVKA
jgi:hypothetical protein